MVVDLSTSGLLQLLIGTVLPILVAVVTKQVTNAQTKAVVLLVLSGLTSVLFAWQQAAANNVDWDWKAVVASAIATFAVAVASHFGFWKPAAVTGSTGSVQTRTADVGI